MEVNYHGVDSTGLNVRAVLTGMENNTTHLGTLITQLEQIFSGDAATVALPLMNKFKTQLADYKVQLQGVETAISSTTGSEGFMKETDHQQGARFMAIG